MSNDISTMTSMAMSNATRTDFSYNQAKTQSLSKEQNSAAKEQELRAASEGFEAIFLQQIWEEMRASMPENSMHGSKEEEYWQSMYSQQLGKDMAQSGGIGLADMMMEQLTRNKTQSPNSKNVFDRTPMAVSPAPLITPKSETTQVTDNNSKNSQISTQALSSQPISSQGDFYQEMEINGENKQLNNTEFKTNSTFNASMQNAANNANNMDHSYYADSYKVENSRANTRVENATAPQVSSALRQTLDELQTLAEPKNTEPTIIRTTYTSNLPASERKNALLDRNGKISASHMKDIQPQEATSPIQLGKRERTMSSVNNLPNNLQNDLQMDNQYINTYPANLLPENSKQATNNSARDNSRLEKTNEVLNTPPDALAGIQARYVSRNTTQENPLNTDMFTSPLSRNTPNRSFFPSHAEVQAELNNLLEKDSNRNRYGSMLASTTQINTSNSHNALGSYSTQMGQANQLGNQLGFASNINRNKVNQMNSLNNDSQIPVFRTMPSLDEALQAGTLIASLSPEQIRMTQSIKNTITPTTAILTDTQEIQQNRVRNATGGPQISQPEHALPNTRVSATSPELSIQMPLANGEISSGFGWRLDPFSKERAWHTGLDIQASEGSNVSVAHDGVVSFAGKDSELGNMIIVDHGNGMQSVYGHNADLLVTQGDKISAGTNIAKVGMSGRAAGTHLHFEIRHNGLPINPEPYLSKNKMS